MTDTNASRLPQSTIEDVTARVMEDQLHPQRPNRELFVSEVETAGNNSRPTIFTARLDYNRTIIGHADLELISSEIVPSHILNT